MINKFFLNLSFFNLIFFSNLIFSQNEVIKTVSAETSNTITTSKDSLLVQPKISKTASKNDIKEEIGSEMKNALHSCSAISKSIAQMQLALVAIQNQLFSNVESLIDNDKKFKNATRPTLKNTLGALQDLNAKLTTQIEQIKQLKSKLETDACLKIS